MSTLPQTALASLAAAGCPTRYVDGDGEYIAVDEMMEWLAATPGVNSPSLLLRKGQWIASASQRGVSSRIRCWAESPRLALYALALAVGAVKEGA